MENIELSVVPGPTNIVPSHFVIHNAISSRKGFVQMPDSAVGGDVIVTGRDRHLKNIVWKRIIS